MKKTRILTLILLWFAAVPLRAATLLVPSGYPTIQAAIDAANNGDTVIISPGVYRGSGNWDISLEDKAVTIRSNDPNDPNIVASTVIDCNEISINDWGYSIRVPHRGFCFNPSYYNSTLDGITIINAYVVDGDGGGGIICLFSAPTIKNCIIKDCTANYGGGICCRNDLTSPYANYPRIINCTMSNNTASMGGGIYIDQSFPTITNCDISNNTAGGYGGGICCGNSATVILTNCIVKGNSAEFGGGIGNLSGGFIGMSNCIISGNSAESNGGGVYSYQVQLRITNSTIAANTAVESGGGVYYVPYAARAYILNSILWGNRDDTGMGQSAQISIIPYDPQAGADIAYNCIQDDKPSDGNVPFNYPAGSNYNIDINPKFIRNPNCDNNDFGDLHLQKTSPCINAGLPNFFACDGTDTDGHPRVIGPRVDIGAYEYAPMINVTNPQSGEVWAGTSTHEINWKNYGTNGKVNILFSTDNGAGWTQISSSDANTGSYLWQLPNWTDSNQCLISVVPAVPDANVVIINSVVFSINSFRFRPGKMPKREVQPQFGPEAGCIKWQFKTGGPVTSAVTVGNDDNLYIACEDGKLYVLNKDDGSLLWSYDANSPLTASAGVSHRGTVYAADAVGKLHTLNPEGKLQWTYDTYGPVHATPVISRYDNIYLCSQDGMFYSLAQDGSELWCFDATGLGKLGGSIFATPQISDDGTIYLAALYDPNLYAINPSDGSIKWTCKFPSDPCSGATGWPFAPPAIAQDGVLYQTLLYDNNLYAIEPEQGKILWSVNLADPCSGLFEPITWTDEYGIVYNSYEYLKYSNGWSQPAVGPDGTIYVTVAGFYLEAVNPDGTIRWAIKLGTAGGLTLTVDKGGIIYAASDDRHLYTIDPAGKIISEFQGCGQLSYPVIAGDRTLIVSDANNTVWALSDDACYNQKKQNNKNDKSQGKK